MKPQQKTNLKNKPQVKVALLVITLATVCGSFLLILSLFVLGNIGSIAKAYAIPVNNPSVAGYDWEEILYVDHTKVSGTADLIDFPILMDITHQDLKSVLNGGYVHNSNGYDIIFAQNGVPLTHQIESYDPTTGHIVVWVKIPVLSPSIDTEVRILCGNQLITTDPSLPLVWNSNFAGVWHLHDNLLDATQSGNDGVNFGASGTSGVISNGMEFISSRVEIPDDNSLDLMEYTVEAWVYPTQTHHTWQPILAKEANNGTHRNYGFFIKPNSMRVHFSFKHNCTGAWKSYNTNGSMIMNEWNHIVMTMDGSRFKCYLNGVLDKNKNVSNFSPCMSSYPIKIGDEISSYTYFNGKLDEIRISSVARSVDWIVTTYNNQANPTGFFYIGSNAPLPIDLLSFDAELENNRVLVDWVTTSEINNDYFSVERSSDGLNYEEIGKVYGAGNSSETREYEFFDESPLSGIGYYRLKQVDKNGEYEFFDPKAVEYINDVPVISPPKVGPNPFTSELNVSFDANRLEDVQLIIHNWEGREVFSDVIYAEKGSNSYQCTELSNLPAGGYILTLMNEQSVETIKLIKQ